MPDLSLLQPPTIQVVRKYISLIIQDEIRNPKNFNPESLTEYVKNAVMVLPDKKEQDELVDFFTNSINVVKNTNTGKVCGNTKKNVNLTLY